MASELRVNTLKDASGNNSIATSFVAGGSAKAWVTIDGTGTVTALDSFNTSSVADTAQARYTPAIASAFSNANYAVGGIGDLLSGTDFFFVTLSNTNPPTTSNYEVMTCGSGGGQNDVDRLSAIAHGDLA